MEPLVKQYPLQLTTLSWDGGDLVDVVSGIRVKADGKIVKTASIKNVEEGLFRSTKIIEGYQILWNPITNFKLVVKDGKVVNGIFHTQTPEPYSNFTPPGVEILKKDGTIYAAHTEGGVLTLASLDGKSVYKRSDAGDSYYYNGELLSNASGSHLLNMGWIWHPFRQVLLHDVSKILENSSSSQGWDSLPKESLLGESIDAAWINDEIFLIKVWGEEIDSHFNITELYQGLRHDSLGAWHVKERRWLFRRGLKGELNLLRPLGRYLVECEPYLKIVSARSGEVKWEDRGLRLTGAREKWCINVEDKVAAFQAEDSLYIIKVGMGEC